MGVVRIDGTRIYLATLGSHNASSEYCAWLNDPRVNKYLETREASVASLKEYIEEKNRKPDCLLLGIFLRNSGKHIGNIKLEPVNADIGEATLGILVGDREYQGKGIGIESIRLITDYAFKVLRLKAISLGVVSENKRAIKAYRKAGFHTVSVEKGTVRDGSKAYDKIVMIMERE